MGQLLKYILIANLSLIIILSLLTITDIAYENYKENYYTPGEVDEIHSEGDLVTIPKGPLYTFNKSLGFLFFYIMPLVVILLGVIYCFKDPSLSGYFKSLIIPVSYIILNFILTIIYGKIIGISGEEGMIYLFIWLQLGVTFIASVLVNLIVLGVKKL